MTSSSYRWRKVTDINREFALFELMAGEEVMLDLGYSDEGTLEVCFNQSICSKTLSWEEFLGLINKGKFLADRDRE